MKDIKSLVKVETSQNQEIILELSKPESKTQSASKTYQKPLIAQKTVEFSKNLFTLNPNPKPIPWLHLHQAIAPQLRHGVLVLIALHRPLRGLGLLGLLGLSGLLGLLGH